MNLLITFIILLILLLSGVPVPFSFGGAIIYLVAVLGADPFALFSTSYTQVSTVTLIAIPMFIMAGGIMEKGKIGGALVNWISIFIGRLKGGLAVVTVVTSAVFGAICGSGAATLSCIGSIVAPQMKERKYPIHIAAAAACCAAPLGLLIPPSTMQIMLAWMMNVSVLACFLSTVIPGIILTILLSVVSAFLLRNDKNIIYEEKRTGMVWVNEFRHRTVSAVPALIMPIIILGGIYSGVMTASESAAVAVAYSIPVAMFVYRKLNLKGLAACVRDTSCTAGVCMCMVAIVCMLSRLLTQAGIPQTVMEALLKVSDNKYVILLMINVFLVILGMIMDDTSAILLSVPILYPLIKELGISPYQFSALVGVNIGMGNITPPSAPFLYLSARIFKTDASKVMKPVLYMLLFGYLPVLILVTYVPAVSLWLPKLIMGAKLGL
ncbi:MAG: TRAP transporter large permease [Pygmaiobacter massiliensis]|nr:TRAP transporter large permease [Pygmaiobacter massiliensis]